MKKRIICAVLLVCLIISAFAGCAKKSTVADNGEQVTLRWMIGGPGKLEDSEKVWAEFNKKLEEYLPNTKVEFIAVPTADYAEKWRLMSASREQIDIAWVSWALNLAEEVEKGAYLELNDLIEKYGQDMKKDFPEWLLDLTTIDNGIYAIPCYQMMAYPSGHAVIAEHVEKGWIDLEEVEKIFQKKEPLTKEDFKIFEEYIEKVQASGEEVKYVSKEFINSALGLIGMPVGNMEPIAGKIGIKRAEDGYKVYDEFTEFPEREGFYEIVNEWYKKGYIRPDILENPTEVKGDYLFPQTSILLGTDERLSAQFGYPCKSFTTIDMTYIPYNGSATNVAIPSTSKNPARAMQLLNLMNSTKGAELLNLLSYGIEGEHYEKISDDRIKWLGKSPIGSSENKYGYNNWMLGNTMVSYTTDGDPEGWNDYIHDLNKNATMSRLAGFTLDQGPIKLEIANYNTVLKEYEYLNSGTVDNYKELLAERTKKLKEAGSEKIKAEVQRQLDEWVKASK